MAAAFANAREVIGRTEGERIEFPELGISILPPKGSTLLGPSGRSEPANYRWPWLRTPVGAIDVAVEPSIKGSSFVASMKLWMERTRENGRFTVSSYTPMSIWGLELARVEMEVADTKYPVVRYFFPAPDGTLAFLHLHGWRDQKALELIAKSMLPLHGTAAQPAGAPPP